MTANEIMVVFNAPQLASLQGLHEEIVSAVVHNRPLCVAVADVVSIKIVYLEGKHHPYRVIVDFA